MARKEYTRERDVERVFCERAKKMGGKAFKWTSPGNDGVPDRILILPGRPPIFVELKTDSGHPSAIQKHQMQWLADHNQTVALVYGMSGVEELYEMIHDGLLYEGWVYTMGKRGDDNGI